MNPQINETDVQLILRVHELAKAFVLNVYKAAFSKVTLKKVYRYKDGTTYEYVKAQYYARIIDRDSAIEYITDAGSSFSTWCDCARFIEDQAIEYDSLVAQAKELKRSSSVDLSQAADYFITDCYTKLFKKSKIKDWRKESKRLSAAISFLNGRYDIQRAAKAYMLFFEKDAKCEMRSDMPYLLKHTSYPEAIIEKATKASWLLLEEFSKYVDEHNR